MPVMPVPISALQPVPIQRYHHFPLGFAVVPLTEFNDNFFTLTEHKTNEIS